MAPILYGDATFTCTRRALLAAAELGQDLEFVHIDTSKGEHKAPDYMKVHPWGRIPSLKNGNFTMYESRAIARYLASIFPEKGKSLVPSPETDPDACGLFEQAASVEMAYINPSLEGLVFEKYFVPFVYGGPKNEDKIAEHRKALDANLEVLDGILATRKYMAGDEFTLVDTFYVPFLFTLSMEQVNEWDLITTRPNLNAWWGRVTSRPSFKKVYGA